MTPDRLVETVMTASEITARVGTRKKSAHERIFITLLFAVIALFLLMALWVGVRSYQTANQVRTSTDTTRTSLALIANSIRMNDQTDAVGTARGPQGLALVLTEHLDTGDYETRLYEYQGNIVEEYARANAAFTPEKARVVVASERFDFTYADNLLTVYTDQGQTSVAFRSVGAEA